MTDRGLLQKLAVNIRWRKHDDSHGREEVSRKTLARVSGIFGPAGIPGSAAGVRRKLRKLPAPHCQGGPQTSRSRRASWLGQQTSGPRSARIARSAGALLE